MTEICSLTRTSEKRMLLRSVVLFSYLLFTCRGWPALLLWSWWRAGRASPQKSQSPFEIYWWGWPSPWTEWSPGLWSSSGRRTWMLTGPWGSRCPQDSPLCVGSWPGMSPDCLCKNKVNALFPSESKKTSGGKSLQQNVAGCVPGRNLSAIFCGEIWVLLTLPVFFPSGWSCRTWPLETGNSSWPLAHPFSNKISSVSHLSLTENQSVKFWEMKEKNHACCLKKGRRRLFDSIP